MYIVPLVKHRDLAAHYRASDLAVWPTQESMSMLHAASTGLRVVAFEFVGERDRIPGHGRFYAKGIVGRLPEALRGLASAEVRHRLGAEGRRKMLSGSSWERFARSGEADYYKACAS